MSNTPDYKWDESISLSIETLRYQTASLLLYTSVLETPIGAAFLKLLYELHRQDSNRLDCIHAYGQWFQALADGGLSWHDHLLMRLLTTDNPFTRYAQHCAVDELPIALTTAARQDLTILCQLSQCTSQQVSQWVQTIASLPEPPVAWEMNTRPLPSSSLTISDRVRSLTIWHTLSQQQDWGRYLEELAHYHHHYGTGTVAQYWAMRWQQGEFVGIAHPDSIRLNELAAYDIPRKALIQNTEALLEGYRALNVLLYGSRGSGKSSLVKALLNEYGDRGLRLIEVAKQAFQELPSIVDQLRDLPQKFIIFVDDLSFEEDDDAFKALKVVLEGSVTARPQNVVVYATSNRRHLIREFHDDRPRPRDADEIHTWDTVQEKLSFSDRFGLTLTFEPADQPTYLAIIHHLAQHDGIQLPADDLDYRALQWATRHNGRSGRTARQFIDALKAELRI